MLGPLFRVEIVTSSRRARYFLLRFIYCALLFVLLGMVFESNSATGLTLHTTANIAAQFFAAMAFAQILCVLLLGPAMVAGTIAVERERRTIEYLLATDLTNAEIVFGKVMARGLQIAGILLAGLPILALAMLLGGVSPEQLWQTALFTTATLTLVVAIAVTISMRASRARDAITTTYLWLTGLLFLPLIVAWLSYLLSLSLSWLEWTWATNPLAILGEIVSGLGDSATTTLMYSGGYLALAAALLLWTTLTLRRNFRQTIDAPQPQAGLSGKRRQRASVQNNPIRWKESFVARRPGWRGVLGRLVRSLFVVGTLGLLAVQIMISPLGSQNGPNEGFVTGMVLATVAACVGLLLVASRASSAISGEREKDTWLTLLSTPLEAGEIVRGKITGSCLALKNWGIFLAVVWVLLALAEPILFLAIPFLGIALVTITLFVSTLGVYCSLRARSTTRALAATIGILVAMSVTPLFLGMLGVFGRKYLVVISLGMVIPIEIVLPAYIVILLRDEGGLEVIVGMITFGAGIIGFGIGASLLYVQAVARFDAICSRLRSSHRPSLPPPPPAEPDPAVLVP